MDWIIVVVIVLSVVEVVALAIIHSKVDASSKKQDDVIQCQHQRAVSDSKLQTHMEAVSAYMKTTDAQMASVNRALERFNSRLSRIENNK